MKKKLVDEPETRAKKREIKKRPRMKMHGKSLLTTNPHAGRKIAKR